MDSFLRRPGSYDALALLVALSPLAGCYLSDVADRDGDGGTDPGSGAKDESYDEAHDVSNDLRAGGRDVEATGLVVRDGRTSTIRARIDSQYFVNGIRDGDTFGVTIDRRDGQVLMARFERDLDGVVGGSTEIDFGGAGSNTWTVDEGDTSELLGPIDSGSLSSSLTIRVRDLAYTERGRYRYRLALWTVTCLPSRTSDYREVMDGTSSRGNDAYVRDGILRTNPAGGTAEPASGIPIAAGSAIDVVGSSRFFAGAPSGTVDGDAFRLLPDRDTAALTSVLATRSGATIGVSFVSGPGTRSSTSADQMLRTPSHGPVDLWVDSLVPPGEDRDADYVVTVCAIDGSPP